MRSGATARRLAALVLAVGFALVAPASPAQASLPPILGAGSTWSQIALDQWRYDVVSKGLTINYQGVGSTQGRQFFANGTVDFAVSEIPYDPGESRPNFHFRYLPIVAGGTSMMYNLTAPGGYQIRDLRLSNATIAGIFTGRITNWNDVAIRRDYGRPLPSLPIHVVVRSDGSGTSAQFSAYLNATQPAMWSAFLRGCGQNPVDYTSFYPYGPGCLSNGVGQRGSDGIANYIANPGLGPGSIGYVETGYAIARNFPVAAVKNASGNYVYATPHNVATALQHSQQDPNTGLSNLSGVYTAPESSAYPISSYSYMLAPTDSSQISTDKGDVLGQFINYFACQGQQQAAPLGYSPLPKTLVQFTFDAEKQIPGAPNPPAINGSACPNPTLTGAFYQTKDTAPPPGSLWYGQNSSTDTPSSSSSGPGSDSSGPGVGNGGPGVSGSQGASVPSNAVQGANGSYTVDPMPAVLTDRELAAAKRLGDQHILGMRLPSSLPFIVVAVVVLLIVVGPLLLRLRSRES
jgi:phosphate transport system substrate-binding protein